LSLFPLEFKSFCSFSDLGFSSNSGSLGNNDLFAGFLFSLVNLIFLNIERVVFEARLLGGDEAHGDEEAEESNEGEDESHELPEDVVRSITSSVLVHGDISLEVPHHEGPEAPGDEVLDREAPPSDEEVSPPFVLLGGVLIRARGNHVGEFVGTVEEDVLAPHLGVVFLRLHSEGDTPGDDHKSPEDNNTNPLETIREGKDSNGSHDESSNPVDDSDDHSGSLSFVREDISGTEEPGSGGALSHTEDEHEVNGNVSVDDIKVGESPRGAEEERSEPSEYADDKSSELSGHSLSTFSVIDDSRDGFDKGESGINSEGEESQTEDESPEVRGGEGLSSGGVSGESESSRGGLSSNGGSNPLEVSNDGEDSKSSEERKQAVSERDDHNISNNWLVLSVVRSVRSHDSHADTEREENLSNSIGPHLTVRKLGSNISRNSINFSLKVHTDTFISVGEAETVHNHDENENARSGDGEPNDVRGRFNSLEYAEVGDSPGEEESKHELPGEFSSLSFSTTDVNFGVVGFTFLGGLVVS